VLCWSAKWLGQKKIYHSKLPDFRGYRELPSKTEKDIDKGVVGELWKMLDECDIAIAHNLKSFDRKKANTRFIINGMEPPSPYRMIDTLSEARKEFKFTSNKLEYIADKLDVTRKMDAGGFDTWLGCEDGCEKTWKKMQKYCDRDVVALDDIYMEMLPWIRNHPKFLPEFTDKCPKCGNDDFIKNGIGYTNAGKYQKLRCRGCGGPARGNLKTEKISNDT